MYVWHSTTTDDGITFVKLYCSGKCEKGKANLASVGLPTLFPNDDEESGDDGRFPLFIKTTSSFGRYLWCNLWLTLGWHIDQGPRVYSTCTESDNLQSDHRSNSWELPGKKHRTLADYVKDQFRYPCLKIYISTALFKWYKTKIYLELSSTKYKIKRKKKREIFIQNERWKTTRKEWVDQCMYK